MLSDTIQAALNVQINEELHSAYIYLAMAAESDRLGLPGFSNWFKQQYSEELAHACLLYTSPSPRDATLSRMPSSA